MLHNSKVPLSSLHLYSQKSVDTASAEIPKIVQYIAILPNIMKLMGLEPISASLGEGGV